MQRPEDRLTSWQAPSFLASPDQRLGWIEEQIQEGEGILRGQTAYKNLGKNMQIFEGVFSDKSLSTLCSNFLKYNIRKFVETISDVREIAIFGSDAPQYKPFAEIENKVVRGIYQESQFPRQLRKANQFAAVMGAGYLWPKCKAMDAGWGERQIIFEPLGLLDVIPVQTPANNDIDEAYIVTVYEYMPIYEAHAKFPLFQSQLKPVDQCDYKSRIQAKRLDYHERQAAGEQQRGWGHLYCEIRYHFITDLSINTPDKFGSRMLPMGDKNTSWYYEVPYVGMQIPGGYSNGVPSMRTAEKEDCRIYPQKRLMITSPGVNMPMYDGPAYDWHGQVGPVKYEVDDWPWLALGLSLIDGGIGSIETTRRKHERRIDQILSYRTNPTVAYDRTQTGGPKIENFDIFEQNQRYGVDGEPKKAIQALFMEELNVEQANFTLIEMLTNMEKRDLGLDDLSSLMNLKMNITAEGADKLLESIGPIAKGIAMSAEASNAKIAYRLKFMIPQWYNTKRLMQYTGPDATVQSFFDYDYESLIPSHMPEEYVGEFLPTTQPDQNEPAIVVQSNYSQMERAKRFAQNLRLISVPSTLMKLTAMEEQLKYLQLYRGNFPISPHTVAKKLDIANYGDIAGDTEFEKWQNWEQLKLLLMAKAQMLGSELGMLPPDDAATPAGNGIHAGGRPPSGQAAPKIKEKGKKDGKPRTTVTESK